MTKETGLLPLHVTIVPKIFSETRHEISDGEMKINTHSLVSGIYFIRIEHENGFFMREFAVSH
jgi:hypothetical protein